MDNNCRNKIIINTTWRSGCWINSDYEGKSPSMIKGIHGYLIASLIFAKGRRISTQKWRRAKLAQVSMANPTTARGWFRDSAVVSAANTDIGSLMKRIRHTEKCRWPTQTLEYAKIGTWINVGSQQLHHIWSSISTNEAHAFRIRPPRVWFAGGLSFSTDRSSSVEASTCCRRPGNISRSEVLQMRWYHPSFGLVSHHSLCGNTYGK